MDGQSKNEPTRQAERQPNPVQGSAVASLFAPTASAGPTRACGSDPRDRNGGNSRPNSAGQRAVKLSFASAAHRRRRCKSRRRVGLRQPEQRGGSVVAVNLVEPASSVAFDHRFPRQKLPQQVGPSRPIDPGQPRDRPARGAAKTTASVSSRMRPVSRSGSQPGFLRRHVEPSVCA